jgi:hypothetical protein
MIVPNAKIARQEAMRLMVKAPAAYALYLVEGLLHLLSNLESHPVKAVLIEEYTT